MFLKLKLRTKGKSGKKKAKKQVRNPRIRGKKCKTHYWGTKRKVFLVQDFQPDFSLVAPCTY